VPLYRLFVLILRELSAAGAGLMIEKQMHSETANTSIDDAVLVERCRQGDSEAMGRIHLSK
jgi:hypothetical protein